MSGATVYFNSAEEMPEIETGSAALFIGASVFFEDDNTWDPYAALYEKVYNIEAHRVLSDDGLFVVVQTNTYKNGQFLCKYQHLTNMLEPLWVLVDERVWVRKAADHFQVPFSHVLIYKKRGSTTAPSRSSLNKRSKDWFQGVWNYPQKVHRGMSQLNSWPEALARLVIETTTKPGDLVVDAFAGSGATLSTAAAMGRRGVGYEVDPECLPIITSNGVTVVTGDGVMQPVPQSGLSVL